MPPEQRNPLWLSRYAAFTAFATLGLIALGGLVTSHGVGMAVPDWPTTYGYNMFLFPVSQWVGGIFYEHTHRLYASMIGVLTIFLALGLQWRAADRRLARLGWLALVLVILQGVLGGLRVTLMKDQIGVLHAALAQAFLVLLTLIAVFSSRWWARFLDECPSPGRRISLLVSVTTLAIFLQLLLGAAMRHQHAGLAVPDFPLAYGRVWPSTNGEFLQAVNAARTDARDFHPITAFHVHLHMTHRFMGLGVALLVLVAGHRVRGAFGAGSALGRVGTLWMALIPIQVLLGAATVWSVKAADVATAHVVVGAACLTLGAVATAGCRAAELRRAHGGLARAGTREAAGVSRDGSSGLPAGVLQGAKG